MYLILIWLSLFNLHVKLVGPLKKFFKLRHCAQVFVNEWAIGRDPDSWDNPNLFSPERFLGSKLDIKGQSFQLTPFGGGRRICPGMPLAIRMLHLMLGSLINFFDWKLENDMKPEEMDMEDAVQGNALRKNEPLRVIPIKISPWLGIVIY